jgi:eukaryotic-like serine/threonine-protein kinase
VRRDLLPPRYRPLRVLGRGATAEVVLARDTELERDVAVKILLEDVGDPSIPERFAREAVIAAELGRHPHVVTVHDTGRWRDRPFLVMEYEPGGSVEEALRSGPVPRGRALRWLRETASAVDAAHARGIVHRDLKPANLLLDDADGVQVSDFGIASAADAAERITLTGTILGTAGYLAPEQARGERATAASDLYTLAVVATELLTGRRPPVDWIPPEAAPALNRGLADRPEERFPTAAELVDAIADGLDEVEEPATVVLAPRGEALAPTAVLGPPHRATGRARRFGRVLVAVAVTALAAAGAVLAFGYVRSDAPTPAARPVAVTCTVSAADHDANLVVTGVKAKAYCNQRARELAWTVRNGRHLRSPDIDEPLSVVCRAKGGGLTVTVYDNGAQELGNSVCDAFPTAEQQAVGT